MARALELRHGRRVIHNHLSVDAVLALFDVATPAFAELTTEIRLRLYAAAARHHLDVVATFVYAQGADDAHLARMLHAARSQGAAVTLVQLLPSRATLARRVGGPSRTWTTTMTDPTMLRRAMADHDLTAAARWTDLTIDNTSISADAVAAMVAVHLGI